MKLAELYVEISARDQKMQSALGRIQGSLNRVGSLLTKFAAAAAAFAVEKVAGAINDVTEAAIDMESRLAQLRKTTGLEGDALNRLKQTIVGLSTTMAGTRLDELFDIATMGGRLGVAGDKIGAFVRDIAMIRVALDDIPAEEAATSIARILNVFDKGTEDAIRFASALNKLDDTSTATGRDILDIAGRLSGPASTLGLSPQKVLALGAALKDAGVENEVGGTALGQVFGKMATEAKSFARIAGGSVEEFTAMLRRDPLEALTAFINGLKRLDSISQFKALEAMGFDGQRVSTSLLQLGRVMDKLNGYVKTADSEWGSLASIMAENAAQGETTRAMLDRMKNSFQATAAKIGGFLLPVVKALANSFGDLAGDLRAALDRNKGPIEAFIARVASMAKRVGLAFSQMPTFLALAKETIQEKLEQIWEIMKRVGEKIWGQLTWGGQAAITYMKNLFTDLAFFLGDLFDKIGKNLGAQLKNAVNSALPKALAGRQVAVPRIEPNLKWIRDPAKNPNNPIPPRPAFNLGGVMNNLPNRQARIGPLNGKLDRAALGRDAVNGIGGFFNRPDVGQQVDRLKQGFGGLLRGKGGSLGGAVGGIGEDLAKRLGAGANLGKAIGVALGGVVGGPLGALAAAKGEGQGAGMANAGDQSIAEAGLARHSSLEDFAKSLQDKIFGKKTDVQILEVNR